MKITVIIPAYNEEETIGSVIEELKGLAMKDLEIIVIDDGSQDRTAEIVKTKGIRLIQHSYNRGYGSALKTGIRKADGEVVVMMDADGQHSPDDIKRFVSEIEDGADMVVGVRKGEKDILRFTGKSVLNLFANYLAGRRIPDLNSGFRAVRRDIAAGLLHILPNGFSFTATITLAFMKEGFEVRHLPISVRKRVGKSKVSIKDGIKTFLLILRMIMLFSPLRLFLPISFVLFLIAVPFVINDIKKGNIADTTILFLLSSLLIFCFGLSADQLAHIRREAKR
jgi:glycosyltransferase involved in cell wall biosynthesis